jgi:hypothetical protein
MPIPTHYRQDGPAGITPPNPDNDVGTIGHITKRRGMKTAYTSVSEKIDAIRHFSGVLYSTEPDVIIADGHPFQGHIELLDELRLAIHQATRADRLLAQRAFQYAERAKEALVKWRFDLSRVEPKERIGWCWARVQPYFTRI